MRCPPLQIATNDSFDAHASQAPHVNQAELLTCCRTLGVVGGDLLARKDLDNIFRAMVRKHLLMGGEGGSDEGVREEAVGGLRDGDDARCD